jgi:hypothetical protein
MEVRVLPATSISSVQQNVWVEFSCFSGEADRDDIFDVETESTRPKKTRPWLLQLPAIKKIRRSFLVGLAFRLSIQHEHSGCLQLVRRDGRAGTNLLQ